MKTFVPANNLLNRKDMGCASAAAMPERFLRKNSAFYPEGTLFSTPLRGISLV
jgi:hypothetical protein